MGYRKEYKKWFTAVILDSSANKLLGTSIIFTSFAIYLGVPDKFIGIYITMLSMSAIFQIVSTPIWAKIGQSKKAVLSNYLIYRILCLSPITIIFITEEIALRTTLFILFGILYALFGQIGYAPILNWRMTLIKERHWGIFFSQKHFVYTIISLSITLGAGVVIDKFAEINIQDMGYYMFLALY